MQAPTLRPSRAQLRTYTGEQIEVKGCISVDVVYGNQSKRLDLLVAAGEGPSLLGRDWLQHLKLNWPQLHHMPSTCTTAEPWKKVLDRHKEVFKEELGMLRGATAKIHLNPEAQPKFYRARSVPYALKSKVELELDHLEKFSSRTGRHQLFPWSSQTEQ